MVEGGRMAVVFFFAFLFVLFFIILAATRKDESGSSENFEAPPSPRKNDVGKKYNPKIPSVKKQKHFKGSDFPFDEDYEPDEFRREYNNYYANIADDAMMGDEDAREELRDEFGDDWESEW